MIKIWYIKRSLHVNMCFPTGGQASRSKFSITGGPPDAVAADRRWREKTRQGPTQLVIKSDLNGLDHVCLLASRNYKVSATVGVYSVVATTVYAILDTGIGPTL
jgi:hypothetical protein